MGFRLNCSVSSASVAAAYVGNSISTMQHSSRMLSIRFFIGFSPPVRIGRACLPRFAVSYISFEPPFRFVWKCDKNPFTYIGTKNRKNSHPKRKIFQKNLRAAKKRLSRKGCSVIFSAISGKQTIFPSRPAVRAVFDQIGISGIS